MMKLCLPYMKEGAGIINVASVAGLLPLPDLAVYGATKAFLLSLSQAVNEEMKERNIHVMALCPYWIKDTEFIGKAGAEGRISEKGILNAEETVKKPSKTSATEKQSASQAKWPNSPPWAPASPRSG